MPAMSRCAQGVSPTKCERNAAAVETHSSRMAPLYAAPLPTGTLGERVEGIIVRRADLFEAMGPVRRAGERLRSSSPSVASKLEFSRSLLCRELREVFSPELAAVIGATPVPRTQVTKLLWDYIKAHKLQNPANKRNILCDEKLKAVMGKPEVTMFEMTGLVGKHLGPA